MRRYDNPVSPSTMRRSLEERIERETSDCAGLDSRLPLRHLRRRAGRPARDRPGTAQSTSASPAPPLRWKSTPEADTTQQSAPAPTDAVEVVQRVIPAVVTVINEQRFNNGIIGQTEIVAGRGTGFVIDGSGNIVTNEHVVRDGSGFEVILSDGEKRNATLVGSDPLSDLAIVRMDGRLRRRPSRSATRNRCSRASRCWRLGRRSGSSPER